MPAPAISAITKYTSQGATKVYWVPTISNTASPTRSELNAGTDLSGQLMDASGWSVTSEQIETPDLATRYTSTIAGKITAEESTLTMYADLEGDDARDLMPRDETGYIVWMDGGDVASNKMDVFTVTVSSVSKQRSVDGSDADTLVFSFAITAEPRENVTVPA